MSPLRSTLLAWALASSALVARGAAQQPADVTPAAWTVLERCEIAASTIVRGELLLRDLETLERSIERGGAYVELVVRVTETLKGPPRNRLRLMFFAAPPGHAHRYSPSADDMRRFVGRSCILQLQQVGNRFFLAERFHHAALQDDTIDTRTALVARIALHEQLSEMAPGPEVPFAAEVDRILDEIAEDPREEQLGFSRLQLLGPDAVPALVRRVDDDRPIRTNEIGLTRSQADTSGPFIKIRPTRFGDALFSVLQEITGQHFGYDGFSVDATRRRCATAGWRIYAQYVLADQANARHVSRRAIR